MLLKAIVNGAHGGFYTVADIGRDELTKDLGEDSKRIPAWQLPDSAIAEAGVNSSHRHRLPDIMFVEMGINERMRFKADNTAGLELPSTIMGQASTEEGLRHAAGPQVQKSSFFKHLDVGGRVHSTHKTSRKDIEEA